MNATAATLWVGCGIDGGGGKSQKNACQARSMKEVSLSAQRLLKSGTGSPSWLVIVLLLLVIVLLLLLPIVVLLLLLALAVVVVLGVVVLLL